MISNASKWDKRFLELATMVGSWSKDPSKKIGAVAVGSKGQILAQGYNGFPRKILDLQNRYDDRETKYKFVVHAEMNVIYNASYSGVSLNDSTIYVSGLPVCSECAKGLIQVGVTRVVMCYNDIPPKWQESWDFTKKIFDETGVEYSFINL